MRRLTHPTELLMRTSDTRPCTPRRALSTAARLLAVTTMAGMGLVHLIKADLDPSWAPISAYALGDHGWVMTLTFLTWSASIGALALAIGGHRGWLPRIGAASLWLAAIGPLLAAIFPSDPPGTRPEDITTTGQVHGTGALLTDLTLVAAALASWHLATRHRNPHTRLLTVLTAAGWLGFLWLGIAMAVYLPDNDGILGPETPVGWAHRFLLVSILVWQIAAAHTLNLHITQRTTQPDRTVTHG